jgi:hypothetical protein
MKIGTLLILLFATATAQSPSPREQYSVIAIQYVGILDKPIFPIIISDSKDGAEWYRTAVLKQKSEIGLKYLHVVDAQLMVKLVRETKSYRDTARKSPGATSTDSGTVSITLVKTGKRIVVRLNIEDAILFLESLKNICGGDISLCSDLQEFQDRMRAMSPKSEEWPTLSRM